MKLKAKAAQRAIAYGQARGEIRDDRKCGLCSHPVRWHKPRCSGWACPCDGPFPQEAD